MNDRMLGGGGMGRNGAKERGSQVKGKGAGLYCYVAQFKNFMFLTYVFEGKVSHYVKPQASCIYLMFFTPCAIEC